MLKLALCILAYFTIATPLACLLGHVLADVSARYREGP